MAEKKHFLSIGIAMLMIATVFFPAFSGGRETYPEVSIENPRPGFLYLNDRKLFPLPFGLTIIFDKITLRADASPDVTSVSFMIDDSIVCIDYTRPFEWLLDFDLKGKHTIKVIARNGRGESTSDSIRVWIFNRMDENPWPLTASNIEIEDIPTVHDFIPIGTVHMISKNGVLTNLPDPKWGLQCFIFVGWGTSADSEHFLTFECRVPMVGWMRQRFSLDNEWYVLPPTKAPMYVDPHGDTFGYPTVFTKGYTITVLSYDEANRTWILSVSVPSKNISIKIIGRAQGVPFWMGKAEGPYIIHGVSSTTEDFDIWGGFWDVGKCTIQIHTPERDGVFYGNFLLDRAYHRTYYTDKGLNRGALAYFSCMYMHGDNDTCFDLMLSHSINPSPLQNPAPMQHQARINFPELNLSYALDNFTITDDGGLQPSEFNFTGSFKDGEIHLHGDVIAYWPPQHWRVWHGLWWDRKGEHTWGRAFVRWNGTIKLNDRIIDVKNAIGVGEFTRYQESE